MAETDYSSIIFLAYLVTFLILFFMAFMTYRSSKKIQKAIETKMNSGSSTKNDKI